MSQKRPLIDSKQSNLARLLGAYVPVTLLRRVLTDGLPTPGEAESLPAATLFADMSGFTAMSEELASDGPRGAEELNRVLLVTFTTMIDIIHQMGGAVSHFYGDAMSVYFPDDDGQAALRALSCAQQMQQLMLTSLGRVVTNRPPDKSPFFDLTIKIGVGYGRCQVLVIGDPTRNMEFVLTGTAVDEAAEAEKAAHSGDVIAGRTVLEQAGFAADVPYSPFVMSLPALAPHPVFTWSGYDDATLAQMVNDISPFVPDALHSRLTQTGSAEIAEHRPVTSMFVQFAFVGDEDNSSAITTAEMGRQLQAYYQWANDVVARYGLENARVNRVLTGDKGNQLHIMFGAPIAPDAPEQALRCALALLREKPGFIAEQKIGLAVGKVFSGPVGSDSRREYTVVGDVVNLSARLMQVCAPNQVWTNVETANRTRQWIEFEAQSEVQLKGKQAAVTPYQAVKERISTSQMQAYLDRWERPLFGRDQELAQLVADMDAALTGDGRMMVLSGPTGVGKSRILGYGTRYWLDQGGIGLLGVCQQHTSDMPFTPWRGVWRDFFGLTPGMSPDQQIGTLKAQLVSLLPGSENDLALWSDPLGLPIPPTDAVRLLTAEARQARFFTMARRCFQAVAKRQSLLIILEGLHWADQSSLALLDEITAHLEGNSIFVAVTFRELEQGQLAALTRPSCRVLEVSDLSAHHARQLLAHLVGAAELPQAVERHLGLRDREGRDSVVNPLFLEEALNVMTAAGVLQVNGRIQVDEQKLAQMQVPDTIHGLLLARLDRLPPATRDLLQVASVIGRQFALDSLTALSQRVPRALMLELLNDLTTADMTRLVTADPEWVYLFQHAMTHEVAYESLPYARRQALHALVADWIQERYVDNLRPFHPILAFHYSRAGIHEDGLRFSLQAAEDARAIFANKEAVELYNLAEEHLRALGIEERWETAVDLLLARSEILVLVGNIELASLDADTALQLGENQQSQVIIAKANNLKADTLYRQGQFDEVIHLTKKTIHLGDAIPANELARAYMWAGWAASSKLDYELALDYLKEAEQICLRNGYNNRLARTLEAISYTYFSQKKLELSLDAMQRSVELSRSFSSPANIGTSLNNIAYVQYTLGQGNEAHNTFNEAVDIARDTSQNLLALALCNRAVVNCYLGDFPNALIDFEESFEIAKSIENAQVMVENLLFWGYEYSSALEDWIEARDKLSMAMELINLQPESFLEERVRCLLGMGQVELYSGNLAISKDLLTEAKYLADKHKFYWWQPPNFYFFGLVHLASSDIETAIDFFQKGIKAVEDGGCPDYLPLLFLALAEIKPIDDNSLHLLAQSVKATENRARFLDRVKCLEFSSSQLINSTNEKFQILGQQSKKKLTQLKKAQRQL
ncbi:MAG: AAA family ATPase [Anaerolineales bacterium]|nr:AAA family ATPase [Anaerolineales bacterium]